MSKGVKGLLLLLAVAVLAYGTAGVLSFGCPVQRLTGVPCPGGGLSRAAASVLRGDLAGALRMHPMIFVLPPVFLYVLFGKKPLLGSKKRERALLWGVIALWIVLWLVRLAVRDPVLFL